MIDVTQMIDCKCGNKYPLGVKYCMGCGRVIDEDYKPMPLTSDKLPYFPNQKDILEINIQEKFHDELVYSISSPSPLLNEFAQGPRESFIQIRIVANAFDRIFSKLPNGMYSAILPFSDGRIYQFQGIIEDRDTYINPTELNYQDLTFRVAASEIHFQEFKELVQNSKKKTYESCGVCGSKLSQSGKCVEICMDV